MVVSVTTGEWKSKNIIVGALVETLKPKNIYEKSEGRSRQFEGLEERKRFIYGDENPAAITVKENGKIFEIDFVGGQKTDFSGPARQSRKTGRVERRRRCVELFFLQRSVFRLLRCCRGEARGFRGRVQIRLRPSFKNFKLNGINSDDHPVLETDAFDYLRNAAESFDLIILDPPAFAKNKTDVAHAVRGYKEINMQAIRRLSKGGFLATFSCSHYVEEDLFYKIVLGAARNVGAELQIVERLGPGPDHPVLLGHPEGSYFKGLLLAKR